MSLFAPEFYVICNGKAPYPVRKELHLSNLFKDSEKSAQLELKVEVININHADNKDLLDSCYFLRGCGKLDKKMRYYKELYGGTGYAIKDVSEEIAIGIERGREEGSLARTMSLARSFRDMGVSLDKIAEATGLNKDEIVSL